MRTVILLLLLVLPAGACWAAPSFMGPTGVINTPDAMVVPAGEYNVFLNFVSSDPSDLTRYGANAGFGTTTPFEVGLTRWDQEGGNAELVVNAKVVLPLQMRTEGALAVGVIDVTDEWGQVPYVVYTRDFTMGGPSSERPLRASIGVASSDGNVLDGLFLNACTPITDRAMLMLEFDAEDFNAGARLTASENLTLDIAVVNDDIGIALAYRIINQ